jgi:hypothetical protein
MTYTFKLARRLAASPESGVLPTISGGPATVESQDHRMGLLSGTTWVAAVCGSAAGQMFSQPHGFAGSAVWLQQLFPHIDPQVCQQVNFLLSTVVGTLITMFVLKPSDPASAFQKAWYWPTIAGRLGDGTSGTPTV